MEPTPEDLRQALLSLRKGRGLTADRLGMQPALVAVLGGSEERLEILIERFESAINSLHEPDEELLLDVFGMSPGTTHLERVGDRRDRYGAKQTPPIKRDAVADRDAAAVERLLNQLITGWYPKSPIPYPIPASHNGYAIHQLRVRTIVRDRRHLETHHLYRLSMLFDEVPYFAIDTLDPTIPDLVGDNFTFERHTYTNGYQRRFHHREPMRKGQTYDLHYVVRNPNPDETEESIGEYMAFHEPARFATFEAKFIGEVPRVLWTVDRVTGIAAPGEPTPESVLRPNGQRTVHAEFRDLYGGLHSGIAWDW